MGWEEGVERGFARNEACRHECFAKAGNLEMLLLHVQQHETAIRRAAAALGKREPRFLINWRLKTQAAYAAR
jgi:hypothetical protein